MKENEVPELYGVIGDRIGSLRNGKRVGIKQKIFNISNITIEANVLATITKGSRRSSSLFLGNWLCEELETFFFHLRNDILRNSMVDHLKETILFTGFNNVV